MKSQVFIFHGTEGYPEENWVPWMKMELGQRGCTVTVPQFPTPPVVAAKLSEWFDVFNPYIASLDENAVIIGHSLGGVFTLKLLEKLNKPIRGVAFIGTPVGIKPIFNYERDSSFSGFIFDWEAIKHNAKDFIVYQSDTDPYVGLANGHELAKQLGVDLSFVPNAGHFNKAAGYLSFEALRDQMIEKGWV